ncbi:MAG TPA: allantoicase [Polyangiaceae bacterium]|jgi:allantoicase|nr:allantoicase [Polyangiaceae bacterium]
MNPPAIFAGLVDLAGADLGGEALGANDDFFAGVENLILPGHAQFDEHRYTERGKWMDGWESRRKRGRGHDHCILKLGARGQVHGFDIDTSHFVGNHPPYASVEGVDAPADASFAELDAKAWQPLLPQVPLAPGSQNLFAAEPFGAVTHVRLSIFPDGGVARFRVYGKVRSSFPPPVLDERSRAEVPAGLVDLAALKNGALAIAASNARFGGMNNMLLPGRARTMGEGWETRRGRPPDHRHDWIVVRLAARGSLQVVEVDTNHYKGNFPERCSLEGIEWDGARITDLIDVESNDRWSALVAPTRLEADTRLFLRDAILPHGPLTHVRLNIFPDGGVSRLRLWGTRDGG